MGMMDRAKAARKRIDKRLAEREKELLKNSDIDWENIAPQLSDLKEQELLLEAVNEATKRNETVGAVLERIEKIGAEGYALAKKVRKLLPV